MTCRQIAGFQPSTEVGKLTAAATREAAARFMVTWYRQTYGRGVRRPVTVCRVTVPSSYAATLVGLRRRLGFSQQQLAAKIGAASKAVVYQWESGKRKPSPVFWLRIERLNRQGLPDAYDLVIEGESYRPRLKTRIAQDHMKHTR